MLVYHPALDPYHSAFRMLHILAYASEREYDIAALRILDFYAVFPQLIATVRLPRGLRRAKTQLSAGKNPYWFTGDPVQIFTRMEPLQQTALNILYAQRLLDAKEYQNGRIRISLDQFKQLSLPPSLTVTRETLDFLVNVLGKLSFQGSGGLKDRTGLLEYRYDAI